MAIKQNLSEIFRHGSVYMIGTVVVTLVRILLLPLFTRYIPARDYGIISLLDTAVEILRIFVAMSLSSAIVRFYHDTDSEQKRGFVISTGMIALLVLCAVAGIILWMVKGPATRLILGDVQVYETYFLLCIANMLCNLVKSGPASHLMVQKKSGLLSVSDVLQLLLAASLNVYLVVFRGMGVMGMLAGNLIASVLVCCLLFGISFRSLCFAFDLPLLRKMVIYSLPLMVSLFAAAGIHNMDRFFIKHYSTLEQVGLYSLAYQFPFMLNSLFASSFERIWGGNTLFVIAREPDALYQFKKISSYYLFIAGYALYACSVAGKTIVTILLAPEYISAHAFIPLISLGVWFYAFHIFFKTGVILRKKTYLLMINFSIAFFVNLIANYFLVTRFQAMGAAVATILTYGCFSFFGYFIYHSCYRLEFDWRRLALFFICAVGLFGLRTLLFFDAFLLNFAVDCIFIGLFPILIWVLPGAITESEKNIIQSILRRLLPGGLNRPVKPER